MTTAGETALPAPDRPEEGPPTDSPHRSRAAARPALARRADLEPAGTIG
jgi:hypothetical protein